MELPNVQAVTIVLLGNNARQSKTHTKTTSERTAKSKGTKKSVHQEIAGHLWFLPRPSSPDVRVSVWLIYTTLKTTF